MMSSIYSKILIYFLPDEHSACCTEVPPAKKV